MGRVSFKNETRQSMVLVDTSVWIDFFKGASSSHRYTLHHLIEQSKDLALCGPVFQEILQGLASDLDCQKMKGYLAEFPYLTVNEPQIFEKAASIYRGCRKRGKTIRKPVDCLIAAIAIENKCELFHKDRDFDSIAACFPLKIFSVTH